MNLRVSLLLVVALALVAGAFALSWDGAQSPHTVGQSTPTPEPLAQALPPFPERKQVAQAKPPAPELAPAVTAPSKTSKTRTPDAAATPAPVSTPPITAEPPEADKPAVAGTPKAKTSDKERAPVVAAPPAQTGMPTAGNTAAKEATEEATKQSTPAVTTAPPETETPAGTKPADKEPTSVVTAPPATEKPAVAAPAKPGPKPVATTTPATERPAAAKPAEPEPTPVVRSPPPANKKPAMAQPAEKKPTPVVTTPPPATDKPAVATTPQVQPTPVVTAPPETEKPAAETASVVAAPTPPPKPVIVMTPLPEERPDMSKTAIQKRSPAKYLFGAKKLPTNGRARAIGYYPKGCLAGGVELPIDGPNWQAMRLSRNRNWGHPELVRFVERFAERAAKATGWPGILVGDMSQPRGGPLPFGHRSHQVGLDVDIWFKPMPQQRLSREQREKISATHLVASDGKHLNPKTWTPAAAKFIRVAAEQPEVQRVLVNAAIKKELCRLKGKKHWRWMAKVRPWYGHDDHIHVRLKCPSDSPHCRSQPAVPGGAGCSNKALAFWFSDRVLHPKPPKHPKPRKQIMLTDLPRACKVVLNAPAKKSRLASETR